MHEESSLYIIQKVSPRNYLFHYFEDITIEAKHQYPCLIGGHRD